jgi:xanthine dehydrogenase molybdopterin-binding subunit B
MLRVFASRQIRNRATLAGNLVTASPIGDIAPVLLALDARSSLLGARRAHLPLADFFLGYRKTALAPDEVIVTSSSRGAARPGGPRLADSYKVSKRRELDISIVARPSWSTRRRQRRPPRAPRLRRRRGDARPRRRTEAFLVGKPWTRDTARARRAAGREFTPITDVRAGGRTAAASCAACSRSSGSAETERGQDRRSTTSRRPGRRAPTPVAARCATRAPSATSPARALRRRQDAHRPMLELWPVTSPARHARIVRRDATAARAMPGVAAVLFAEDIPGTNDVGAMRHDEPLLADEVSSTGTWSRSWSGDSYGRVPRGRASSRWSTSRCPRARLDAADRGGQLPHQRRTASPRRRDAALAAARTARGDLDIGGQEHFYLETQAAWAERGDDGDVFVCSSTQHPSEVQAVVAHVLHLPAHKVVVEAPRMGGGFGGKETQGNAWAALVALAARSTGRPVRVQLDRDLDMRSRASATRSTRASRWASTTTAAARAHASSSPTAAGRSTSPSRSRPRALPPRQRYYLPAVRFFGRVAKTHVVSHTAFRGFGGPQGMVVIEEIIDRVARTSACRPRWCASATSTAATGETNTTHYGQPSRTTASRASGPGADGVGRTSPSAAPSRRASTRRQPVVKRGLAITPVKFGISFTATFLNQAGALVLIYRDGSVQVNHGGTEMGQGLTPRSWASRCASSGSARERVRVMKTRPTRCPTPRHRGLAGADLNGAAVRDACVTLRERLAPVAARPRLRAPRTVDPCDGLRAGVFVANGRSVPFAEVVERAYLSRSAVGHGLLPHARHRLLRQGPGQGKPVPLLRLRRRGDRGRGRRLQRHEAGAARRHPARRGRLAEPGIDRGQVEGAFVQGRRLAHRRGALWDAAGRLLTHSASTYQIPPSSDAPRDFRVTLLPDAAQPGQSTAARPWASRRLMLAHQRARGASATRSPPPRSSRRR